MINIKDMHKNYLRYTFLRNRTKTEIGIQPFIFQRVALHKLGSALMFDSNILVQGIRARREERSKVEFLQRYTVFCKVT